MYVENLFQTFLNTNYILHRRRVFVVVVYASQQKYHKKKEKYKNVK